MTTVDAPTDPLSHPAHVPLGDPTTALLQPAQIGPLHGVPRQSGYRAVPRQRTVSDELGPLQDLPGIWEGPGFSLIARPDFDADNPDGFFLQLNLLRETIEFTSIGSPVFNRGSLQSDIAMFGVTYLHRVTDAITGEALHIEPGLWLTIPPTTQPESGPSIARLATVPHGNAACAFGHAEDEEMPGLPTIPPVNTVPFPVGSPVPPPGTINPFAAYDLGQESPFRTSPVPPNITQAVLDDPNTLLRAALRGLQIQHITRLITNTPPTGGVANIPFITANADNPTLNSVFAIQSIVGPGGREYQQLQYAQTALLNFRGLSWPHVTVGTLVKAF
ncbi:heme-binding protein [Kineosporia sp. NBRC 101731]|uniref:heme-binding protein n=1 Tax=Kineosporia sp. NBRC 101731 TaxID=3032199 RepID=UPI0024A4A608|nr:heme-binding protein [Kineosporia sp. NBRC 101731]GLY29222.1 hypothetical protein Kisp02_25870 [Kineosporia sp. NBRC 101731]